MDIVRIRESEVDRLLSSGGLEATGKYSWTTSNNKSWARLDIPVVGNGPRAPYLRIIVSVNLLDQSRYNFSLLWNNIRIRALDVNGSHENNHTNNDRWVHQTHKHRWTDQCQERFAYTPSDIIATELGEQLAQFCAECGISYSATLAALPLVQGGLFDDL